jgi:hypothetical protein
MIPLAEEDSPPGPSPPARSDVAGGCRLARAMASVLVVLLTIEAKSEK